MNLEDVFKKFSGLEIYEKRQVTNEYIELVFLNKQIDEWNKILTDILGPVTKPAGEKPSKGIKLLAEKYGGIFDNQSMFKKDFDSESVIAMLWPWQDDIHTTLKISLEKK